MELIRAENISFSYSDAPVLANISVSVKKGEIISLLGPNGSGKTTLIKVMLGIFRPRCGAVFFEGKSMLEITPKELSKRIAYVPQFHRMVFAYRECGHACIITIAALGCGVPRRNGEIHICRNTSIPAKSVNYFYGNIWTLDKYIPTKHNLLEKMIFLFI